MRSEPASASPAAASAGGLRLPLTLADVQARFPDHAITCDRRRDPVRYISMARHLDAHPSALVTADLVELACVLAMTAELADLRARHPGWTFETRTLVKASGPDQSVFIAQTGSGELITAFSKSALSERIRTLDRD